MARVGDYKYQWARHVARKSLVRDAEVVKREHSDALQQAANGSLGGLLAGIDVDATALELRDLASNADQKLTFGEPPKIDGKFHMGIIGSGVSGLFTALIIDKLNERSEGKLKITYDILEATGPKRLGGRLYTHRFTDEPSEHQYYDVGAMRFPDNEVMDRTFRLFKFLGMTKWNQTNDGGKPDLIPYYLIDKENVCPKYFNDKRVFGNDGFKAWPPTDLQNSALSESKETEEVDPYQVNKWLPKTDPNRISRDVIEYDPNHIIEKAIAPLTNKLREDLDAAAKKTSDRTDPVIDNRADEGWKILNTVDSLTTRQFFSTKGEIRCTGINGCGYNFNTVEWLETYAYATGWYNQSLAETVLETLDFDPPKGRDPSNDYWYCVEGGTQLVAKKMAARLTTQPTFNKQVTAIKTNLVGKGDIELTIKSTKPDDWDSAKTYTPEIENRSYFTVFNSTTLGALQRMDLSSANLLYGTKQAIRSLNYGASCKAGIQFTRMWWMEAPWNITQGGIARTDLPIRVCVYPSYNVGDTKTEPGVLLCSYSWAQDAQRIGTLIDPESPKNEDELKDLLLSNLAQLHAKPDAGWPYEKLLKYLHELYKTHHAYDWYHDPNMAGAFAYFGPGQFSQMWPEIIKPNGWLFLIGEACSAHHGWIVGALESAVRAVYQLLLMLNEQVLKGPEKRRAFSGYKNAMQFLAGPKGKEKDPDWDLPFVGLPREIPIRQEGTAVGDKVQEMPEDKEVDLTWLTAQVITSFFEMVIEAVKAEAATTGASDA